MSKFTRKLARSLGHRLGRLLSFEQAALVSEAILETKGIGTGSDVRSSGEVSVFERLGERPIIFDVGGHAGDYTDALLRARPAGHAFVFEPSDSHFRILEERLGSRANVTLEKIGLGARACEMPLYKTGDISGLASLTRRRLDHFGVEMDVVETVAVRTLDEIIAQYGVVAIDLLKIDVEGHELDVLSGGTKAFRGQSDQTRAIRIRWLQPRHEDNIAGFLLFLSEARFHARAASAIRRDRGVTAIL